MNDDQFEKGVKTRNSIILHNFLIRKPNDTIRGQLIPDPDEQITNPINYVHVLYDVLNATHEWSKVYQVYSLFSMK